jgi:hypothetical protein
MLCGHPFAGKSMLVSGILQALQAESSLLGLPTTGATALLLTEEHDATMHERAASFGLFDSGCEFLGRSSGIHNHDWPQLVGAAAKHAVASGHRLLVVDTFPGLAQLRGEEENDAGAVGERLAPLQKAAGKGLAVLFLHHMNKYGQPRGSKAFRGVVDISIALSRPKQKSTLTLSTESRFHATPEKLRGKLINAPDQWFYELVGGPTDAATVAAQQDQSTDDLLLRALAQAGPEGLTYEQIDALPGLSVDKAKKRLPGWYAREPRLADRAGGGTKTDPYRWFAVRNRLRAVRAA